MPRIVQLAKANDSVHKWVATFDTGKKTKFGAVGYEDYTQHKDAVRRERYRARHKKDLRTNDPTRPGFLSFFVLWGPSTSIEQNVKEFNRQFG